MTTITRWAPFQDATTVRAAMSRLFEESIAPSAPARGGQGLAPALNLSETAEAFAVEVVVPGVKAEDLKLTFENGLLTIAGELKQEGEQKERSYHRVERRYGSFTRSISFPTSVRGDAIEARLDAGVLYLTLPKAEEVKPRQITISVAQ